MSEVEKIRRAHLCGALQPNIAGSRPAYNQGMLACLKKFVKYLLITTISSILIIQFGSKPIKYKFLSISIVSDLSIVAEFFSNYSIRLKTLSNTYKSHKYFLSLSHTLKPI